MNDRRETYRICSRCGERRPPDLFWDSDKYEEMDDVCTICAVGDYN